MLFGETELDAFRRLRRSEILEPEVNKVMTLVDQMNAFFLFFSSLVTFFLVYERTHFGI